MPVTDACAQAELVRTGQATPVELARQAIDAMERLDPRLNAVIHRRFEQALAEAASPDLPDGPFRGVPILLKDLWCASAGDPFHQGVRALKEAGYRAPHDDTLTTRYRDAGFVVLGRTNTPELGLSATTEPLAYGATHNPWALDHGPGGSSGGAAAAVAAGMVAVANASDGGGSIRIPAALCGLVGLKPSRGRISMGPDLDEWGPSVQHVVCHSVRDAAAILDVCAVPGVGDGVIAPTPPATFAEAAATPPARPLRIGLVDDTDRAVVDPDCAALAGRTGELLAQLGHRVEPILVPEITDPAMQFGTTMPWAATTALQLERIAGLIGRPVGPDDVEPATWAMARRGRTATAVEVAQAAAEQMRFRRSLARRWVDDIDLLLTPTTAQPAPVLGELAADPENPDALAAAKASAPYTAFCSPFNATGQPAISLPMGRTGTGLPIGAQLVAAYGREDLLLAVAGQLEEAAPWAAIAPLS